MHSHQVYMRLMESFCKSVREGPLSKRDLLPIGKEIRQSPTLGTELIPDTGVVFYWDFTVRTLGDFRWYYLYDQESDLIVNLKLVARGRGPEQAFADLSLAVRVAELVLKLFELA